MPLVLRVLNDRRSLVKIALKPNTYGSPLSRPAKVGTTVAMLEIAYTLTMGKVPYAKRPKPKVVDAAQHRTVVVTRRFST